MGMMRAPPIIDPADIVEVEDYGAPDIFATGWTMGFGPEVITGISHVDRMERGIIRRQIVCRVHYPRSQWMAAVSATLGAMKGGGTN